MKIILPLILLVPSMSWGLTFKNGEQVNSTKYMYCKQINTGEVTKIEWKTFNCPTGYEKTNASDYSRNKKEYGKVVYCINNSTGKVLESRSGLCLNNYSKTSKLEYDKYKSFDINKNSQNKVTKLNSVKSNIERYIMEDSKLYVNADALNIRDDANGNIIDKALKNERLAIIENKNNWSKVITKEGLEGWVSSQYLSYDIDNRDDYIFCWNSQSVLTALNFNNILLRKGQCLTGEIKIQKDLICQNKSLINKKLLDECANKNSKIVKNVISNNISKYDAVVDVDMKVLCVKSWRHCSGYDIDNPDKPIRKTIYRGDFLKILDDISEKSLIKVEDESGYIGYTTYYGIKKLNLEENNKKELKNNTKSFQVNNLNNYVYCTHLFEETPFPGIIVREGNCKNSEYAHKIPYWCDVSWFFREDLNIDPKLLAACDGNKVLALADNIEPKKIDPEIINEKKVVEIELSSNQVADETSPKINCNKIGTINSSLANLKCKISDDNELFAVVVNGKQIEGNLQNLNEQIQVPFGNSKIEVVAYDSFGNQENLILNVNREFSLANSQEDIERLFPGKIKDKSSKNKVAVIIGIQNYADIPDTKYSDKDAMAFAEFANQTLNISSKNIKYLFNEDAKYFGFKGIQTWLENKVNKNTDVYVFYSGHGLGVEGKSKLLPSDFVTQFQEESSYEKDEFLSDIANLNPNHIYAFFDTCFSGLGRNGETLVAGLKNISIVEEVAPVDNITIFNSSSGLEYSTDFDEAEHGLFSYYLMKGLEGNADLNSDNEITSKELFSFISDNVSDRALDIGLSQNPSLIGESNNVIVRW